MSVNANILNVGTQFKMSGKSCANNVTTERESVKLGEEVEREKNWSEYVWITM